MATRPVQVSIDEELLRRLDADPDARQRGRSAFVRTALRFYLEAKQRRELEAQLGRAYQGRADDLLGEVADMITDQPWPAN
ncbi:MAG: ribbon-helix-helix domain-containing protein [Spirochaetaceae bacterium]|nr:ribbon-helix-helix domain-containing protein [Spirochaetaceae bacterium]